MSSDTSTTFVSGRALAELLGVPESYIRRESRQGHIPALRVGQRLKYNPEAVRKALLDRAKREMREQREAKRPRLKGGL